MIKEDLKNELKEYIIEKYEVRSTDILVNWLEEEMKDLYDYNKKTFFTLNEKETYIFRKKFCEHKTNIEIAKEFNMVTCNVAELIRRKKREIIKRMGVMYRLHFNKDTDLENTLLWPTSVEKLSKTGLKTMNDIIKLSEREFEIITSFIPSKIREEVLNMMKTYKMKFEGPEIIIEENDLFIDQLNLKSLTLKSLFWSGIRTKSQIMNLSKEEIKQIIGLGQDGINEIINIFEKENIELKEVSKTKTYLDINNIPISRLNLNTRTLQALYRNNIKTIDELFKLPAFKIKCMKGLGATAFYELIEKLRYIGYEYPTEQESIESIRIEDSSIEEYLEYTPKQKQKTL